MDDFEQLFNEAWVIGKSYEYDRERMARIRVLRQRIVLAREARAKRQQELILEFKQPLLSLTTNVPGPDKDVPMASLISQEATRAIRSALDTARITVRYMETRNTASGPESFWILNEIGAKPLKRLMIDIENGHPLGQLFDIDVLDVDGTHLERASFGVPPRRCLLCDRPAYECIRSQKHSLTELINEMGALVLEYLREQAV